MEVISDKILNLVVPADSRLREEIRQKTDSYFVTNVTIPPVSYERLAEFADILIAAHGWDINYKAFVMICIGNAIWRQVVGAVPFDRRMLLLPQCLRNSQKCKAQEDELGLLCNECGNCSISGFIREAEDLGYITVVAEGATIASRLVESGKVDAIIGVSCMETLQKIFRSVNKYSVPAIGIPLLTCGCIDTVADAGWIRKEINYRHNHNGFRLLNLNDLGDKTASLFTKEKINTLLGLKDNPTDEVLRDILLAGGKRIRPLLTALAYQAFSKDPDTEVLQYLAMSVECFHKASLVHDDIEDGDDHRYGKETVHKRHGIPVAINIGDLLIGEGYRLVSESRLDPAVINECLKIISGGHILMSEGQGAELMARRNNEIVSSSEILQIFRNKTAEAFKVSLLTGALAGGADADSISILEELSYLIGTAYQLKDDLEDITEAGDEHVLRNPSAVISALSEKAVEPDKETLKNLVIKNDINTIRKLIEKYNINEFIDRTIEKYLAKIDSSLSGMHNIPLKLALHEIVGKTFSKYL
jgi:geranylgeranyl pyrophosphate synthase